MTHRLHLGHDPTRPYKAGIKEGSLNRGQGQSLPYSSPAAPSGVWNSRATKTTRSSFHVPLRPASRQAVKSEWRGLLFPGGARGRRAMRREASTISGVARSSQSLWLWLGAGLIAVGGVLMGVVASLHAGSTAPYWTSGPVIGAYALLALSLVCFGCATREVPIPYTLRDQFVEIDAKPPEVPVRERPALPSTPVRLRLVAERDMVNNHFRLVALNRGDLGHFRAEVIRIRDQDDREPLISRAGWPVPWLDDGSVTSKDIPAAGSARLDFAHFNLTRLREDLETTKWLNGNHWTFPTLPKQINVTYSAVADWEGQDRRYFLVTVRVIRDDPQSVTDIEFKIGTEGQEPYCREYTTEDTPPAVLTTDELVPGPASTDYWRSTYQISGDLLQLQNNSMWHSAYTSRSPQEPSPASLRIGIIMACGRLPRDSPPTSAIRAALLGFLNKPEIMNLVSELTDITGKTWKARDEHPRLNFGAVLAGDDESEAPVAWARLLLPEGGRGADPFGRDARYADLVVHVELGTADGSPESPASLPTWHQRFTQVLKLPAALARLLTNDLGLATSSDPPTEIAIWLRARGSSLVELVDTSRFSVIPGTHTNLFLGLAAADPHGQPGNRLAQSWLGDMCDSLHLDGHEPALKSLAGLPDEDAAESPNSSADH